MINNNHIQLLMSVIKIKNEKNKTAGKRFKSDEQLLKTESVFIKIANRINTVENIIINNRISNWVKEHLAVKIQYPVYLYCDDDENYIYDFKKSYQIKSFWKRLLTGNRLIDVELSVTSLPKYAMNIQYLWWFQKNQLLKDVNRFWNGDRIFRIKRVITYN